MTDTTTINHRVLLPNIEDKEILRVNIMNAHSFRLGLKQHKLRIGLEKLILYH